MRNAFRDKLTSVEPSAQNNERSRAPNNRLGCNFRQTALLNAIIRCYYKTRSRYTSKQELFHKVHTAVKFTKHHNIQEQLQTHSTMKSSVASSYALLISPLMLCFAFECISALASPAYFVFISLGH